MDCDRDCDGDWCHCDYGDLRRYSDRSDDDMNYECPIFRKGDGDYDDWDFETWNEWDHESDDESIEIPTLFNLCLQTVRLSDTNSIKVLKKIVAESRYQTLCKITNIFNKTKMYQAWHYLRYRTHQPSFSYM